MEPCPNCGQTVLQMAKTCRHCGTELDDQTFFLDESAMVQEIMALKKESEEQERTKQSLAKKSKISFPLGLVCLCLGVVLLAAGGSRVLEGIGALSCVLGVVATLVGLKFRKDLQSLGKKAK